jgi:hypothetical protein
MPANFTDLPYPCRYCGGPAPEIASAGIGLCRRCDDALSVVGQRPVEVTDQQYRDLIVEIGEVIEMLPQHAGETFDRYKHRVILGLNMKRIGRPFNWRSRSRCPRARSGRSTLARICLPSFLRPRGLRPLRRRWW